MIHPWVGQQVTIHGEEPQHVWTVHNYFEDRMPAQYMTVQKMFMLTRDNGAVMKETHVHMCDLYVSPGVVAPVMPLSSRTVEFEYLNHRGQVGKRTCVVIGVDYGSNEWYAEPQFFLRCMDQDKCAIRSFALNNIQPGTFKVVDA